MNINQTLLDKIPATVCIITAALLAHDGSPHWEWFLVAGVVLLWVKNGG